MPKEITLYHNPRCSKSRAALQLLEQYDAIINVINYQTSPPDAQTLRKILQLLNLKPIELVRTGEAQFKSLTKQKSDFSEQELVDLMVQFPILIERPIVVTDNGAAIGRPIGNIVELLNDD